MPRFQKSRGDIKLSRQPEKANLRVAVYESGRKAVLRSDVASLRIFKADGTEDLVVEEHEIGKFAPKETEEIMRNSQKVNLKKMSKSMKRASGRQ